MGRRDCRGGLLLLLTLIGCGLCIDVRFEDATSGFFLRTEEESSASPPTVLGPPPSLPGNPTEARPFTVRQGAHWVSLRATYGPFLSRQSVPATLAIPDLSLPSNSSLDPTLRPHLLDLSAHLVTREVRKDSPVLRVLFHTGQRGFSSKKKNSVCIVVWATLGNRTVSSECSPGGRDGTCLGEVTVPSGWWPGLATTALGSATKHPKIVVGVTYSVMVGRRGECGLGVTGSVTVGGPREVGRVPLEDSKSGYQQVAGDETLHLLIPQTPLYPGSRLYVPVFVEQPRVGSPLAVVVVKCRARRGVRIAGVEEASEDWTLRVEVNSRGSVGTVTAFRKDANTLGQENRQEGPQEIFNWLYLVEETEDEVWEGGKLAWQVKYQHRDPGEDTHIETDNVTESVNLTIPTASSASRLRHRLEVRKDDVQTVVPISKSWFLMNTAVLTGRQVSQPMKIFIVSEAGKIADVTLHTSCKSQDDSSLKVSSSCTSVYVDGSESRGAISAEVKVKYGTFSGQAHYTVWMPESPLTLEVTDSKLSPIKAWKVPDSNEKGYQKRAAEKRDNWKSQFEAQAKKDEVKTRMFEDRLMEENQECQERYQQTQVAVFARFLAEDPDSGRRDYYISRLTLLDVTDLVSRSLRTSESRVARVRGRTVLGLGVGRTEVQVVSPLTGTVLGRSELRVVKQQETVKELRVKVVSGISLAVTPTQEGQFLLHTVMGEKLTSKYQEGLLDIQLVFSDGSMTPLKDIDPSHYYLTVDSLNSHVIAFAPVAGSSDPRVIAVGGGQGELLQISLELADECHQKDDHPLATSMAGVTVDFVPVRNVSSNGEDRTTSKLYKTGKDNNKEGGMKSVDMGDLSEILSNIALRDDNSQTGHFDSKHVPTNVYDQQSDYYHHSMTPLEIGMYILLGVFCIAIAVFMASCFVYASKHQQPAFPLQHKSQSVQNAHDWVWLGRQTLDKSSVQSSSSRDVLDNNANSIRSRNSSRTYQTRTTPGLPYRFEASADVNIFPNPCSEYGFQHRERPGRELYAELPRKRLSPRTKQDNTGDRQQLYQNSVTCSPRLSSRSPFLERRAVENSSISSRPSLSQCSTSPPGSSSHRPHPHPSSLPPPPSLVNSATYTRQRPVVPSRDFLPVGFPVFSPQETSLQPAPYQDSRGFQNPWEALQLETKQGYFTEEEEEEEHNSRQGLRLDLTEDPPPGYSSLRQSPASALPPYPASSPESQGLIVTPQHIAQPRGEYIPLNPDINKPSPPRIGARKVFVDPFNITDDDAPPVATEQLSPSHIFSSLEELHTEEEEREEDMSATDLSGQEEDNCSSVCSVDSGELGEEELAGDPQSNSGGPSLAVTPYNSLTRRKATTTQTNTTHTNPANLDSVALGSLDYEHLMNYFESLKESSA